METQFFRGALAAALLMISPVAGWAQHEHHHPEATPEQQQPAEQSAEPTQDHSMHDMAGHEGHDMAGHQHQMRGMLGDYPMSREASGTAWQPESSPHEGLHTMRNGWHLMAHGFVNLVYDDQGGPRGGEKTFSESMFMGMASRDLGPGHLGLRTMLSAEPWTIGDEGYPLLFQTGETANGRDPLVDRQHPHDLFMELAGTYSVPVGEGSSAFIYLGLPGEPALGPATFMHRFSGMENPEAPLGHHWLDSTHVTFGVATLGWIRGNVKLEGSVFTGREPDEDRLDIEEPKMDSWSLRASWQPTRDWSLQVSHGYLHSPEQLEPEIDARRTTASAIYNRPLAGGDWQSTFAWGRNERDPGETTDSFLLESTAQTGRHTVFGRAERQENDELSVHGHGEEEPEGEEEGHGEVFTLGKISLGYIYDFYRHESWRVGVGGLGTLFQVPDGLKEDYGDSPTSWMAFLRVRL
jgi:hypothetical protein